MRLKRNVNPYIRGITPFFSNLSTCPVARVTFTELLIGLALFSSRRPRPLLLHRQSARCHRMQRSGVAGLSEAAAARSDAMDDDDTTQVSGREAQRLAGIARQAHPAAHAQRVAASHAAAQRRTEQAMPGEERRRRRREHAAEVRARKKQKEESHDAPQDCDAAIDMDLLNVLLRAEGHEAIDDEEMDAFEDWLWHEGEQLQLGDEVKLAREAHACAHACAHMLCALHMTRARICAGTNPSGRRGQAQPSRGVQRVHATCPCKMLAGEMFRRSRSNTTLGKQGVRKSAVRTRLRTRSFTCSAQPALSCRLRAQPARAASHRLNAKPKRPPSDASTKRCAVRGLRRESGVRVGR